MKLQCKQQEDAQRDAVTRNMEGKVRYVKVVPVFIS
jgi:hypothetical protein